jgi:hypothetical protein
MRSHQLGKLGLPGDECRGDLRRSTIDAWSADCLDAQCSPWFPARSGTGLARSKQRSGMAGVGLLAPEASAAITR